MESSLNIKSSSLIGQSRVPEGSTSDKASELQKSLEEMKRAAIDYMNTHFEKNDPFYLNFLKELNTIKIEKINNGTTSRNAASRRTRKNKDQSHRRRRSRRRSRPTIR
jgi:hypothetical protein